MVRKASRKPDTARMYRHFAAITLAVTAAMAMFADGEHRQAVAREIEVVSDPVENIRPGGLFAERKRAPAPAPAPVSSPGEDFDPAFGSPMETVASSGSTTSFASPVAGLGGTQPGGDMAPPGISPQEWASTPPAQRGALVARRKAQRDAMGDPLEAASRARSGGSVAALD